MASDVSRHIILLILSILLNCNIGDATEFEWKVNKKIIAVEPKLNYKYDDTKVKRTLGDFYFVQNIGRDSITVTAGFFLSTKKTLKPTCSDNFNRFNMLFFFDYLKIINNKQTRAIVYISKGTDPDQSGIALKGYDRIKALEKAFTLGVKKISNLEGGLSVLLNAFWSEKKNVWLQLFEILKEFLSENNKNKINNIIKQDLETIKTRIADLNIKCKSNNKNGLASIYMEIAKDLVDLENKFIISREADKNYIMTNFYILPLYTNVVTMKIHFYAIGVVNSKMFQLDDDNVKTIKKYSTDIILNPKVTDAIKYLRQINRKAIDAIYKTVYPAGLYNVLMVARTHLALHAMEMIPIWKQTSSNPFSKEIPYIDAISYSYFYGKPSPDLYQQATPTIVSAPLNPPLDKDKRAKLLLIVFYMCTDNYDRLVGVELTFESNKPFVKGDESDRKEELQLNGRTIKKLEVDGDDILQYFKFTLSDATTKTFGIQSHKKPVTFELKDHHIISLYVANDLPGGFIDNIAVSFARDY